MSIYNTCSLLYARYRRGLTQAVALTLGHALYLAYNRELVLEIVHIDKGRDQNIDVGLKTKFK
jgi:hypothetical protein